MACDEEAYKTFSELFGPVVQDLHPRFDFRYSYHFEEICPHKINGVLDRMRDELEKMENCRLVIKRNFRGMPFLPHMSKEHKLQVERKVVELVGELYGQY